jgi:hypothetical protein
MKEMIPKTVKILGVMCFSVFVGYLTLSNSFDKSSAIAELKELKLTEIALLDKVSGTQKKISRKKELLEETELCLQDSQLSFWRRSNLESCEFCQSRTSASNLIC